MNSATPLQPAISSRNLPIFPSSHLPIHSSTHPPQHSHPLVSVRPPRSSVVVATVALRAWSALERARRNVSDRGARGQNLPAFGLWRLALLLISGTLNFKPSRAEPPDQIGGEGAESSDSTSATLPNSHPPRSYSCFGCDPIAS
jgi:hypothetical protein